MSGHQDGAQLELILCSHVVYRMVAAVAGPFGRNMSQGPVGGVLGEMGYKSDEVWKL